jgi:hypothetical protein
LEEEAAGVVAEAEEVVAEVLAPEEGAAEPAEALLYRPKQQPWQETK